MMMLVYRKIHKPLENDMNAISTLSTPQFSSHNRRGAAESGSTEAAPTDVFTPSSSEEANPMAAFARLRRPANTALYGNNAGQASGIEREDFPCMGAAFVCNSCA